MSIEERAPGSVYVNFLGVGDQGEDRVKAAYGPNYARLAKHQGEVRPVEPVPPQPQHTTRNLTVI